MCRAITWLRAGDYEQGWLEYEWRWKCPPLAAKARKFTQPQLSGTAEVKGKTVLLHAEQGMGDTLQFVRYAAVAKRRG